MEEESNKLCACIAGSNEGYQMGRNPLLQKILIALASKRTVEPALDRKAITGTDRLLVINVVVLIVLVAYTTNYHNSSLSDSVSEPSRTGAGFAAGFF
jgi:hypothetical protein